MSPRASRDGKEGRRSWRYAKSSSKAARSKKPYVVFLTLLLLGSVGLYWWAVRRTPVRNAYLAVIEVPANPRILTTPFALNDIRHLRAVTILRQLEPWNNIRDNSDFDLVGPNVRKLLLKPHENLILYINAPGISHDGTAYLTHSDFLDPNAAYDGRHAVSDLLADLAVAGEGVKLIVLDSTSVDIDPRLGMVVNEFVHLLEADVTKLKKDSNLFVLLPSGPFQVSTTSYGDRQSLFGKYLTDGLAGAADRHGVGDRNGFVTLYELYEYVRVGCATSIDSSLGVQQTPVLLQAGIGYVPPSTDLNSERLRLTQLTERKKPPAQEPPKAIEEKGDTSTEKQSEKTALRVWPIGQAPVLGLMQAPAGNNEGPVKAAAEPKEKPAAAEQPAESEASKAKAPSDKAGAGVSPDPRPQPAEEAAPAKLTPREQLLSQLEKAWRLRDAIQNPHPPNVTPVTFAPHLWRNLEAELLFVERQVLADPVFDRPEAETEKGEEATVSPSPTNVTAIEGLIRTLTLLQDAISSKTPSSPRDVRWARLFKAWDQYVKKQLDDDAKFEREEAPEAKTLRDQALEFDLLVYSLPYYVRWHARAHQSLSTSSIQHTSLKNYLDATVHLATTLSSLRAEQQLRYSDQHRLKEVSDQLASALLLRSTLDNALWEDRDRGSPIIAERLLATPLLDAEQRMQLLRALVEVKPKKLGDLAAPVARQDWSVPQENWRRLHDHCKLDLRLVELALGADHDGATSLTDKLASANTLTDTEAPEESLWKAYRGVGAGFRECLVSLPESIIAKKARDYALHIVDSRDVDDPAYLDLDVRSPMQLHLKYEPEVRVEIAEKQERTQFELKLRESRQFVLTIRATREEDASQLLTIDLDRALLAVVEPEQPGPLEKKFGWFEQTVVYEFRAKDGATQRPGRTSTNVTVWSNASKRLNQTLTLKFTLPRKDEISLEVLRLSSQEVQLEQDDDLLRLGLFPANLPKPSEFKFRAHNKSGEPKKISAKLYLVKPDSRAEHEHGMISEDRRQELREDLSSPNPTQLELIAEAEEVEVAVDKFEELAFKAPAAAPAAAAAPPAAEPEKSAAPQAKVASHGMVCVLEGEAGARWIKWIEFEPIPLQQYLNASAWYERGRVVVSVSGKSDRDNHFPADGLDLTWDTRPDFPDGTDGKFEATILRPGDEASMYVAAEPDGVTREVYIGVNGCPRALFFDVPCRESRDGIKRESTRIHRRSIAITKLSIPGTKKVFHIPVRSIGGGENFYLDGPPRGAERTPGEDFLERNQPVIVPMPVDELRVHFHVDAPVEGVERKRGGVEVLLDRVSQKIVYDDRRLDTHYLGLGDNGVLQLAMQLQEQFIDIKPDVWDKKRTLVGKLTLDERSLPERSEEIPVIFDSAAPVITDVVVPEQIDLGSKQFVEVEVDELSGISDVRYWFSAVGQQPVKKPLTAALLEVPSRQGKVFRLRFNVDTAEMDERKYVLAIEVDDPAGHTSLVSRIPVEIKKKVEVPVVATISGAIKFSVGARLFISVELLTKGKEEVPGFPPQRLVGYRYKFNDVPAGEYIVRAKSDLSTNKKQVDETVKVEKPGDVQVDFDLK